MNATEKVTRSLVAGLPDQEIRAKRETAAAASVNKVFVIDDHPVVLEGVRHFVNNSEDFLVVGGASNVSEALPLLKELQPVLVILDLVLGGRDGAEAITDLISGFPKIKILVFSMNPEEIFARRAIRAGAHGYMMKTNGLEDLLLAMRQILRGEISLNGRPAAGASKRLTTRGLAEDLSGLTEREMQVLLRIGEGKTTEEIAVEMSLSAKTIATHRENLKSKLGCPNAVKLHHLAMGLALWFRGGLVFAC